MFIKNFKQLSAKDVAIAGGKGASLSEMTRAKMPVPPGFVVLASAFDEFLKISDLNVEIAAILKKVNSQDIKSVEEASIKIRDLIRDAEFPEEMAREIKKSFKDLGAEFVAVRSSATAEDSAIASWAGELESYLDITEGRIAAAIQKCWSSLYTPRAIFYRFEKNLHERKVLVAVVVQKMIQSEVSGICFTAHPVTKDLNQMVIEAGWGLGEAIVGGIITPDTYIVDKPTLAILDVNVSRQEKMISQSTVGTRETAVPRERQTVQKISNKDIVALAKICKKIEEHYGAPQDIEWALEGGKFYIVQSRPITTL
ncbi:MAG: PEP/pyruvate-binding domain-containing protein [Patescibacteria group bacterium]|nr:PEP/pyruvate-binding domain-containing protein [Patescibacteria group bacterium]